MNRPPNRSRRWPLLRSWPVIKREFGELVRSRAYILGTLMGPILIVLLFAIPFLLRESGGGGSGRC